MRIGIDARFWGPSHTGLGVYTKELINHLAKIDNKNEYTLLIRQEAKNVIILPENFSLVICEAKAYSFKEQYILPGILYSLTPDIVHFPSINVPLFYLGKFVVTVHDLIKHESRGIETTTHHASVYWFKYIVYRVTFWVMLKRAMAILVPSKAVKTEIMERYPFTRDKIVVTPESYVLGFGEKEIPLELPSKFAIYTGNAYPHKNLPRLLSAWEEVYEKTGVILLINSGRSVFTKRMERLIIKQNAQKYVQFRGYLSDQQLDFAYQQAILYVFPSTIEGFGIPGLDAMSCNLPVVCSDIPVLREVYGEAAYYFDPFEIEDMTKKLVEVIKDKNLRYSLIAKGREQIKKYSWDKTARNTLATYEQFKK